MKFDHFSKKKKTIKNYFLSQLVNQVNIIIVFFMMSQRHLNQYYNLGGNVINHIN